MFVHSNLLKHLQGGVKQDHVFAFVKRMARDEADEPSLNYAHLVVENTDARGMCLDLTYRDGPADQKVHLLPAAEVDKLFVGFEKQWRDEGGLVGGW